MTLTIDMTMLAIIALVAGIAAFFAPRFIGIAAGVALCVFAVVHLFPEVRDDLQAAWSALDTQELTIERAPAAEPSSLPL